MLTPIPFQGLSGKTYHYFLYDLDAEHMPAPANYVVVKVTPTSYEPVYIGETEDVSRCFGGHELMSCFQSHGAMHVCLRLNEQDQAVRAREKQDLIDFYQPPCNRA